MPNPDCLCLSTVSVAMASPSPANALPHLSVCRLMNSDWVNSRLDRTHRVQASNATQSSPDETEIETRRDKRWEFPLEFKVKLRCLSPLVLLSPAVFSLFVLPPSTHLTHHVFPPASHSFSHSYLIPTISPPISLPLLLAYLSPLLHLSLSLLRIPSLSPHPHHPPPPSPTNTSSDLFRASFPLVNLSRPARSRGQMLEFRELQATEVSLMAFYGRLFFYMHVLYLLVCAHVYVWCITGVSPDYPGRLSITLWSNFPPSVASPSQLGLRFIPYTQKEL